VVLPGFEPMLAIPPAGAAWPPHQAPPHGLAHRLIRLGDHGVDHLQSALVLVNTRLVDRVLDEPQRASRMDTAVNRRGLTPLFWSNVALHGPFELDLDTHLDYRRSPRPPDLPTRPDRQALRSTPAT
jgi:hypothetical protein